MHIYYIYMYACLVICTCLWNYTNIYAHFTYHPGKDWLRITCWLRISFSTGKKFERPGARQLGLCNMCLCMSKKESRHVCEACVHVNSCFPLPLFPRVKTDTLQIYNDNIIMVVYIYIYASLYMYVITFYACISIITASRCQIWYFFEM